LTNFRGSCVLAFAAIAVAHSVIFCAGAVNRFPVVDEIGHLPAGISHWRYERFDLYRVNPPLVRLIASFPAWISGDGARYDWNMYTTQVG